MVHHQVYKSRDFMRKSNRERVTSGKFEKKIWYLFAIVPLTTLHYAVNYLSHIHLMGVLNIAGNDS